MLLKNVVYPQYIVSVHIITIDLFYWEDNPTLNCQARGSIRSSPRYGWSLPYRSTIRNSARLFYHVLFNMEDLHLVLPAPNLSSLNAGILIMMLDKQGGPFWTFLTLWVLGFGFLGLKGLWPGLDNLEFSMDWRTLSCGCMKCFCIHQRFSTVKNLK